MATPFVAGSDGDPTAGLPEPDTFGKIQDQWNTFLAKPEGQAALLSFGINLMQPPSFGDNPVAQVGRALGHAGETVGNIEKMDIAQEEAASKQNAREAAANLAEAKAGQTGLAAQLAQEKQNNQLSMQQLVAKNNFHAHYLAHIDRIQKENAALENNILNPPPGQPGHRDPKPIPTPQEFIASDPIAASIAASAGIVIPKSVPSATPTTLSPLDQQALDWANANPSDPKADAIHKRLGR